MIKKIIIILLTIIICIGVFYHLNIRNIDVEITNEVLSVSGDNESDYVYETKDEISKIIENMTLHEKICQMIIVAPEILTNTQDSSTSGDSIKNALNEYPVSGLIYFANNLESQDQTKQMINATKQYAKDLSILPLFYSVDEEGGIVARCASKLGTTKFAPMYNYRNEGIETAYNNAKTIAEDISKLGFNLDFAPVADTWSNKENTVIGARAYSDEFSQTAELVASAVKGFNDGGVYCTLKHFPGHGETSGDSHHENVYIDKTVDELSANEYLAFQSGITAGADFIMMGHIIVKELDSLPASLSYKVINDELKEKLGYEGIVITDSLAMGAVSKSYDVDELAVMAVKAGNDILLMPSDLELAVNGIKKAIEEGEITEERINESVRKILEVKEKRLTIY
ncbi:MAG: glycoside hydrolase family 3 protein [Clostridia bacterium]|nr:glycoside hydrolase family 3 protein [Clostridia bacterium]